MRRHAQRPFQSPLGRVIVCAQICQTGWCMFSPRGRRLFLCPLYVYPRCLRARCLGAHSGYSACAWWVNKWMNEGREALSLQEVPPRRTKSSSCRAHPLRAELGRGSLSWKAGGGVLRKGRGCPISPLLQFWQKSVLGQHQGPLSSLLSRASPSQLSRLLPVRPPLALHRHHALSINHKEVLSLQETKSRLWGGSNFLTR